MKKRNFFGEPVPANFEEIQEALIELDFVTDAVSVMIDFDPDEGEFHGFTAEVRDDDQGRSFTTLGCESKEELINDLVATGIGRRQIDEY